MVVGASSPSAPSAAIRGEQRGGRVARARGPVRRRDLVSHADLGHVSDQVTVAVAPLGFLLACVRYVVANGGVRGLIIMRLWRADGT
jgi:hypothetical protein